MHIRFDSAQDALGPRVLHAALQGRVVERAALATLTRGAVDVHGVGGADQLVVVHRQDRRYAVLREYSKDRRRELMVDVVQVRDVRTGVANERIELVRGFSRVEHTACRRDARPDAAVRAQLDVRDEVLLVRSRLVVRILHGEWDHFMAIALEQIGEREVHRLRAPATIVELVDVQYLHAAVFTSASSSGEARGAARRWYAPLMTTITPANAQKYHSSTGKIRMLSASADTIRAPSAMMKASIRSRSNGERASRYPLSAMPRSPL